MRGDGPDVRGQLVVFAREIREAHRRERALTAELEVARGRLDDASHAAIETLALVVAAKDRATAEHLERSSHRAIELARHVAPELVTAPETRYGFLLHDIGKIGIPEAVLGKPGPLAGAEWDVMRTHPEVGVRIVARMPFFGGAVDVIRSHHERFDGTGYPWGLAGEAIPLAARIFAVADAFDAMTSDRPYRRALPRDRALDEVRRGSGTQFDPEIVRVFVRLEDAAEPLPEPGHADRASGPIVRAG